MIAIVVCRRSWLVIFSVSDGKSTKEQNSTTERLWKVPQLWKSKAVAFGNFFLMISTVAWKAQNAFHTYHEARLRLLIGNSEISEEPKTSLPDLAAKE